MHSVITQQPFGFIISVSGTGMEKRACHTSPLNSPFDFPFPLEKKLIDKKRHREIEQELTSDFSQNCQHLNSLAFKFWPRLQLGHNKSKASPRPFYWMPFTVRVFIRWPFKQTDLIKIENHIWNHRSKCKIAERELYYTYRSKPKQTSGKCKSDGFWVVGWAAFEEKSVNSKTSQKLSLLTYVSCRHLSLILSLPSCPRHLF